MERATESGEDKRLRVKHGPVSPQRLWLLAFRRVFTQNYYRTDKWSRKKIFWNAVPRGSNCVIVVALAFERNSTRVQ